jgi:hypothetical protein
MAEDAGGLLSALKELESKRLWQVAVSVYTGSDLLLKIGEKWQLPRPGHPGKMTEIGEYHLYVVRSWRLEDGEQISHSSADMGQVDDEWVEEMRQVAGQEVRHVEVGRYGWDVVLQLDGGSRLTIFSDQTGRSPTPQGFSYRFLTSTRSYTISGRGQLEVAQRFNDEELRQLVRS